MINYSTAVRCGCKENGKSLEQKCLKLWRKDGSWNSRHGSAGWIARIPTSSGTKLVKRYSYPSRAAADAAGQHAMRLLELAADDATRGRIGDLITATKHGQPLPSAGDVRRRLGLAEAQRAASEQVAELVRKAGETA